MIYRTIYIENPAYLKLKNRQLKILSPDNPNPIGSIPIEDIGILMQK